MILTKEVDSTFVWFDTQNTWVLNSYILHIRKTEGETSDVNFYPLKWEDI